MKALKTKRRPERLPRVGDASESGRVEGKVMAPRSIREQLDAMKRRRSPKSSASTKINGPPVAKARLPANPSPAPPKTPKKVVDPPKRISPKRYVMAVTIPSWIACRPELSNAAKLCYGYLAQLWNPKVKCAFPSEDRMAGDLGCSDRTARRAVKELRDQKLLSKSRWDYIKMPKWKAPKRKRVYRFLKHPWAKGAKKLPKKRSSGHLPVIDGDHS
jgi:hypothetical protein